MRRIAMILMAAAFASGCASPPPAYTRDDAAGAIAEMRRIVSDKGIERLETVELGGVEQWISIRGQDRDNPVLLFLHGGPGFATLPMSWTFQQGWEDYFTVVQWDQRGAGKTHASHDPETIAPTMTKAQIIADTEELIQWLRQEYGKEKIILAGLSWGSVVGIEIAQQHPDWLHAYVGFGQVIDFEESERRGWAYALSRARAENNEEAIRELESIAPYPPETGPMEVETLYLQRKWIGYYGGAMYNRQGYGSQMGTAALSPDYTARDVAAFQDAPGFAFPLLFPEMQTFDVSAVQAFDCPIILFLGRHDYNVAASVASEWFETLQAPAKELVWFERSGHVVMSEEPGRTLVALVEKVLPFAEAAGDRPEPAGD